MTFDRHDAAPEIKASVPAGDAQDVYDALMRTFEDFKSENDARLKTIEKRGGDVVIEEKVARIDAALDAHQARLDQLSLKGARPALAADSAARPQPSEHKGAFDAYIRGGDSEGLRQIETKAMSVGSNADGGYLVPTELETIIGERLTALSPHRRPRAWDSGWPVPCPAADHPLGSLIPPFGCISIRTSSIVTQS